MYVTDLGYRWLEFLEIEWAPEDNVAGALKDRINRAFASAAFVGFVWERVANVGGRCK